MNQESLWQEEERNRPPLAVRLRPVVLDDIVGQNHILAKGAVLRKAVEEDRLFSCIFFGPPGCGKTSLAEIIGRKTTKTFYPFSAARANMSQLKPILDEAMARFHKIHEPTVIFVDEVHRFNKLQQDVLLPYMERGEIILIGATTENPSFELNPALLSRCKIFVFHPLSSEEIDKLLQKGWTGTGAMHGWILDDEAREALIQWSGGDARVGLNFLEIAVSMMLDSDNGSLSEAPPKTLSLSILEEAVQQRIPKYRKQGDEHFDLISAMIKSMRASDPDAVVYYIARMLEAGEDPLYLARRMIRFASEDVGMADPFGLMIAVNAYQACMYIGMPECTVNLAQSGVYLAVAAKSNRLDVAYTKARQEVQKHPDSPVPLWLRNPVTGFMKNLGYGKAYQYPHNHGGFVRQRCVPEELESITFYSPSENGKEKAIKDYLSKLWRNDEPSGTTP